MSVTLPSDLLVGVMHAAPEVKVRQATARLEVLDEQWSMARRNVAAVAAPQLESSPRAVNSPAAVAQTFKGFESMLLRNMLESMLPKADTGLYGDGVAGGIWRSMAADQFANLYADRGGAGIAGMLSDSVPSVASRVVRQWPYFPSLEPMNFAS